MHEIVGPPHPLTSKEQGILYMYIYIYINRFTYINTIAYIILCIYSTHIYIYHIGHKNIYAIYITKNIKKHYLRQSQAWQIDQVT